LSIAAVLPNVKNRSAITGSTVDLKTWEKLCETLML